VHDISDLELRGVPGMFVASDEFVDAAIAQSTSLGFPSVARVFTPHPIQDRTDDEMIAYADATFDVVLASVTSGEESASDEPQSGRPDDPTTGPR
jgi:hypothetical protein